jgi:hypothetical protein
MNPALPKLEYLLDCSQKSLEDLELAALNRSQQCLKAAKLEMDEAVAQREAAGVARWLIENRVELLRQASLTLEEREDAVPFPARKTA